jgi:uncharacterized surface protein with fasciclin (FAS1) repeats
MNNIVQTAITTPDLSTLVSALTAADLVATLEGTGPFTVFAPTNEAFAKLPQEAIDSLLMPENKSVLSGILTYHVVSGIYNSSDLSDEEVLTTVQGETLTVKITDGKVMIVDGKDNSAEVITADLVQSNGVVHLIDTVLMPE